MEPEVRHSPSLESVLIPLARGCPKAVLSNLPQLKWGIHLIEFIHWEAILHAREQAASMGRAPTSITPRHNCTDMEAACLIFVWSWSLLSA
jgi:hypothetical protein